MGAGMVGILVLVIIVAVLIGLAYAGVGAGLWKRRTDPEADVSQPDMTSPEATELRHDPEDEAGSAPSGGGPAKTEPFPNDPSDRGGTARTSSGSEG